MEGSSSDWVEAYNKALARREYKAPKVPGPHCCAGACAPSLTPLTPPLVVVPHTPHPPFTHPPTPNPPLALFPVCCTFFASFGALFLFLISGLMRSNYRYIHIEGDLAAMQDPVSYAGALTG